MLSRRDRALTEANVGAAASAVFPAGWLPMACWLFAVHPLTVAATI